MNIEKLANKYNYVAMADDRKSRFWAGNMTHWLRYYGPYNDDPKSIDYFCNTVAMFYPKMLEFDADVDSILPMIIRQFLKEGWTIKDRELALNECLKAIFSID